MNVTKDQLKAALAVTMAVTMAVAEAIREAKQIPSGVLYTAVMDKVQDVEAFDRMVEVLVGAGVVRRDPCHVLTWVWPAAFIPGPVMSCGSCRHMAEMSGAADHWCTKLSCGVKPEELRESRRYL